MVPFCDQKGATSRMNTSSRNHVKSTADAHSPTTAVRSDLRQASATRVRQNSTAKTMMGARKSNSWGQGRPVGLWT